MGFRALKMEATVYGLGFEFTALGLKVLGFRVTYGLTFQVATMGP